MTHAQPNPPERLLYWIAALGALTLLLELVTGLVLWLALPRGAAAALGAAAATGRSPGSSATAGPTC